MLAIYQPSTRSLRTGIVPGEQSPPSSLFDQYGDGFIVVLAPGLRKHFGPYAMEAYLAHRLGASRIGELDELERVRRSIEDLDRAVARFAIPQGQWG